MAKFKRYDYSQKVLIPVSLEEQLVPGSLEFAIHTLVESRMDMSVFGQKGQSLTGCCPNRTLVTNPTVTFLISVVFFIGKYA
jgi:hypothetical protein